MVKKTIGKRGNFKKKAAAITLTGFLGAASPTYALPINSEPAPEKNKSKVSIILGARKGIGGSGLYGGELGVKYKRFALVGNMSSRSDINLQNIEEEMIRNVYFQGREDLKDFSSIGASLEYHQPIAKGVSGVIGIGGNFENYARNIEENLVRKIGSEETLLASNTSSVPEKEFVGNIYAGPSFKITKWLELNPNIGYEKAFKKNGLKERGVYVNLRAILSFSKRGNR